MITIIIKSDSLEIILKKDEASLYDAWRVLNILALQPTPSFHEFVSKWTVKDGAK